MDEELKEILGLEDDSQDGAVGHQDGNATDEGAEGAEGQNSEAESNKDDEEELLPEDQEAGGAANHQQSHEDNHKYAEARKKAEADLTRERQKSTQLETENKMLKEALEQYGYTGNPQEIADQLVAKRTGKTAEDVKKERELKAEEIRKAAENSPEVQQAKNFLNATAQQMALQHLHNINMVNPEIKTMEDLFSKTPKDDVDAITALVEKGWHIDKAYFKICGKTPKQNVGKPDTKQHMKQVNGSGTQTNDVFFDKEEYELARDLNPGLTEAQYRDYLKKEKRS